MNREILDKVSEEWKRVHKLHQNYLNIKEEDPSKAGEHIWGALNNLLSAFHRIQSGRGIGKHRNSHHSLEKSWNLLKDLGPKTSTGLKPCTPTIITIS